MQHQLERSYFIATWNKWPLKRALSGMFSHNSSLS